MSASVVIYSSPFCGYCSAAKKLLKRKNLQFTEVDVLVDPSSRGEMIRRSGRYTVPQIFFGDSHIGGFDELEALESSGELDRLLGAPNDK